MKTGKLFLILFYKTLLKYLRCAAVTTEQKESIIKDIDEVVFQDLQDLLKEFRQEGRSTSPTFQFWDDFLTRVMLISMLKLNSFHSCLLQIGQYIPKT